MIEVVYVRQMKRLLKRLQNGVSVRSLARILDISHPTMLAIAKNPSKPRSRKLMLKVLRKTNPRRMKIKTISTIATGNRWFVDAL